VTVRGEFGWVTDVGVFDPDPAFAPSWWGLPLNSTAICASARTADGERRCATRQVGATGGSQLLLQRPEDRSLRVVAPVVASGIEHVQRDGTHEMRGDGVDVVVTRDALTWRDAQVDLEGEIIGPGLQHFTPWPHGGLFYTSRLWTVRGRILDDEVDGFLLLDQWYLDEGYHLGDFPVVRAVELAWHTFGNRYADGSLEAGTIGAGHGGWGFALINDATGPVVVTADVDVEVLERDREGWPLVVRYAVGNDAWEWRADPRGHMIDFGHDTMNPQSEGQLRRVGDTRTPLSWMGWGETCVANGDRRRPAPAWPV
jgi:hypothetical protein